VLNAGIRTLTSGDVDGGDAAGSPFPPADVPVDPLIGQPD